MLYTSLLLRNEKKNKNMKCVFNAMFAEMHKLCITN